jgi:D-alanine-D-alanine ligase
MTIAVRIGVLMGGRSVEREVSLRSGEAVLGALRRRGLDAVGIDVDTNVVNHLARERVGLAFIALHGRYGEDGTIQGLLEILGIPYTGSGVLASALGMDKLISRALFAAEGLPVPRYVLLTEPIPPALPFPFPVVVKPNSEGSSVGVSLVSRVEELPAAIADAFRYDRRVLIEAYIAAKEVQIGILGDRALGAIEIRSKTAFYDYTAKYTPGMSEHIFPATLAPDVLRRTLDVGLAAFRAVRGEGYGRVDCLVDEAGTPHVLEVNTLPGLTETSLLPDIARGAGLSFDDLVAAIVRLALERKA